MFKKMRNKFNLTGEYGIGYTSKGKEFYFDLDDYDKIKDRCWYINSHNFVVNKTSKEFVMLHRLVMAAKNGEYVDHINHSRIDNRKRNLRIVTNAQNQWNKSKQANNTSGIRGVTYDKSRSKWQAQLTVNGQHHKRRFSDKEDAIAQRKSWEEEFFGEYNYKD